MIDKKYNEYLRIMNDLPYYDYLKTEHWKHFRKNCLDQFKECMLCNSTDGLSVHHKYYGNKGRETFRDIIVLCNYCHEKTHYKQTEKNSKNIDIEKMETIFVLLSLCTLKKVCFWVPNFLKPLEERYTWEIKNQDEIKMELVYNILEAVEDRTKSIILDNITEKKIKNAPTYVVKSFNPNLYINDITKEGILYGWFQLDFFNKNINEIFKEFYSKLAIIFKDKLENHLKDYKTSNGIITNWHNSDGGEIWLENISDVLIEEFKNCSDEKIKDITNKTLEYQDKKILYKKVVIDLNDYYFKHIKQKQTNDLNDLL